MNHLKKQAWKDFISICFFTIAAIVIFSCLDIEEGGITEQLPPAIVLIGFGLYFKLRLPKRLQHLKLDERERSLWRKSFDWGVWCFVIYMILAATFGFVFAGSQGMVPARSLPLIVYSGVFLFGIVRFVILIYYTREDNESIEGGNT